MTRTHRRSGKFLPIGIAATLIAGSVAAIGTFALANPSDSAAPPVDPAAGLQREFADAAQEFHVPQSVLMAVSYHLTRWETHQGRPSTAGNYNVMGLTQVTAEDVEEPTRAERLSHLNMSGDPARMKKFNATRALRGGDDRTDTSDPRLHTLDAAAELTGESAGSLRTDREESVRGGAALLAKYEKEAAGSLPDDPGRWYAAVARYSQAPDAKGAQLFTQRVFQTINRGGSRVTSDGQRVTLPADPSVTPVKPAKLTLAATFASTAVAPVPECPSGLNCDFRAAAFQKNGTDPADYGNYDVTNRPADGVDIRYIVIHDTEGSYDSSLSVFQDPAKSASAHYLIRASDGLVTQTVPTKDTAWHAGNKTLNMHSIGIEHEGFAIKTGSWYSEPQYESSAALVKYLAARFGIPLDREHIIGHDEVPGPIDAYVAGMHWDPGPYWDWNHYFALMGAPTGDGGAGSPVLVGQEITVAPPFTTANQPAVVYCSPTCATQTPRPANFLYLYTAASTGSPLIADPYLRAGAAGSTQGPDWAAKAVAGSHYVVAAVKDDWTAIWYGGRQGWFYNPGGRLTAPAGTTAQPVVTPKAGLASIPVYGRAYPQTADYTGTDVPVQADTDKALTKYSLPAGQAYVPGGPSVAGDYFHAMNYDNSAPGDHKLVTGTTTFLPIRFNHRLAWVRADDVRQISSTRPASGATRSDVVARDSAGVLWQYQGSGGGAVPFLYRYRVGAGWQGYNALIDLSGFRADGTGDLIAREPSGVLWYYKGTGNTAVPFATRVKAGSGWQIYNALVGVGDVSGDGKPDLIARDTTGVLWLYRGTGNATAPFATRLKVGTGWQMHNMLVGGGDMTGDGKPDLIARDTTGVLWLYRGTGNAAAPFATRLKVGTGWQMYNLLAGTSDLTGDGKPDLLARDTTGRLWTYPGTGNPSTPFAARLIVTTGWQMYNALVG
ncbi:N-acetylmuramoyl-L-alanine amidase [Streptomyces sp. RKAG293]|uniref:N-acetylmuramoyl-L-alanine amidase n=1 Tax=Streptomyces sp. RKAG293 TaxID=2893403 RepID=UPI0020347B37|nr:N-acetylmuramoyl-L-alanine amidase [Streptomyces sp. RKAG293]MCM2417776.1 N-acetylmuramoyl-L-alanine amidase [Streptomyces sp. RKAG293]